MNTPTSEFESPLPHKSNPLKPVPVAGFIFEQNKSAKFVPSSINYRKPRLVKGKSYWYITYTYRVPLSLRHLYKFRWERFKVKQDINRHTGKEKEQYAEWLLEEIRQSLKDGYNPFTAAVEIVLEMQEEKPEMVTAENAFKIFLEAWSTRGLEPLSLAKYRKCVNRLADYLHRVNKLYKDIRTINTNDIEAFLVDGRTTYKFSNREYNNTFDFIRTCFNYLVKKSYIEKSPCAGVDKLKVVTQKHRYYDADTLKNVTKALLSTDPYCYLAVQVVYYLCIRSDKELMNLKVGNIKWSENKILLDSSGTKAKSEQYVPMDYNIKELLLSHGIDKYPAHYFVFGVKGIPAEQKFSSGFFSRRFKKARRKAGLPAAFSMYGFKHTRIIHLKQDGLSDADIMSLTRHKDFSAYARYLRDLGLDANPEKINAVSRKL